MAKLSSTKKVTFLGDAVATLREPSNEEWSSYQRESFPIKRKMKISESNIVTAKASLFDKIIQKIENLEDDAGKITEKDKDRIPARIKAEIIFIAFEQTDVEDTAEKN